MSAGLQNTYPCIMTPTRKKNENSALFCQKNDKSSIVNTGKTYSILHPLVITIFFLSTTNLKEDIRGSHSSPTKCHLSSSSGDIPRTPQPPFINSYFDACVLLYRQRYASIASALHNNLACWTSAHKTCTPSEIYPRTDACAESCWMSIRTFSHSLDSSTVRPAQCFELVEERIPGLNCPWTFVGYWRLNPSKLLSKTEMHCQCWELKLAQRIFCTPKIDTINKQVWHRIQSTKKVNKYLIFVRVITLIKTIFLVF